MAKICPDDGAALATKTIHNVQVDVCPTCGGVWLDSGEIAQLRAMPAQDVRDFEGTAAETSGTMPARSSSPACPICQKPLTPFHYAGGPLVLETCPDLHGIWITRPELDTLATEHDLTPEAQKALDDEAAASQLVVDHYNHIATILRFGGWHLPWPI